MCHLPYGLTVEDIESAARQVEHYIAKMNEIVTAYGLPSLHQILAPNAISGLVSELMAAGLGTKCCGLVRNSKAGGFPDLLPVTEYPDNSAQRGTSGIEVKASKNTTWQGHNSEDGWLLAIKYCVIAEINKVQIDTIYLAALLKEDWTFCPRKENSRRTPTASINKSGLNKLRNAVVYKNGE